MTQLLDPPFSAVIFQKVNAAQLVHFAEHRAPAAA
jgi:hypothetical protein